MTKTFVPKEKDTSYIHSKYWLKYIPQSVLRGKVNQSNLNTDYVTYLSSINRGVKNMISSISGEHNVSVSFDGKDKNKEDGIVLNLPETPEHIDASAGMALHEGSHILLSKKTKNEKSVPFHELKEFLSQNPKINFGIPAHTAKIGVEKHKLEAKDIFKHINIVASFIEDNRVDTIITNDSYGYIPYYDAFYKQYVFTDKITKMMNEEKLQEKKIVNYLSHIINTRNPSESRKAPKMPQFEEMVKKLDIKNVLKYSSGWDNPWTTIENLPEMWKVASEIVHMIYVNSDPDDGSAKSPEEANPLIDGTISAQGNPNKTVISNSDLLDAIEITNKLEGDIDKINDSDLHVEGVVINPEVIIYKKLTPAHLAGSSLTHSTPAYRQAVTAGVSMGNLLANRITMIQDESREESLRKKKGKLDKRLLSSIANGDFNIFKESHVVMHKPIHVHISLDASSSMRSGRKWERALTLATAMARVADKVRNFNISISVRTTEGDKACLGFVYDSTKDNFQKLLTYFPHLGAMGSTPEGLLYEPIIKKMDALSASSSVLFINISDGIPNMHIKSSGKMLSYGGQTAYEHTKKKMSKMNRLGIKVLSYFVSTNADYGLSETKKAFDKMYGKDSQFIDTESITQVARTVNSLILKEQL